MLHVVQLLSSVDRKVKVFQFALEPLRQTLQLLGVDRVSYADMSVASQFLVAKHSHMQEHFRS